jgi:hypothetical protein
VIGARSLAQQATRAAHPAYFKTAHELVDLGKAYREGTLDRQ